MLICQLRVHHIWLCQVTRKFHVDLAKINFFVIISSSKNKNSPICTFHNPSGLILYLFPLVLDVLGPVHTNPFSNENGAVLFRFQKGLRPLLLLIFSVTPFKIDQNKRSKPFNRLSLESGNRKKVDMQRLSPRFRSQQFFLSELCGETFFPNL